MDILPLRPGFYHSGRSIPSRSTNLNFLHSAVEGSFRGRWDSISGPVLEMVSSLFFSLGPISRMPSFNWAALQPGTFPPMFPGGGSLEVLSMVVGRPITIYTATTCWRRMWTGCEHFLRFCWHRLLLLPICVRWTVRPWCAKCIAQFCDWDAILGDFRPAYIAGSEVTSPDRSDVTSPK